MRLDLKLPKTLHRILAGHAGVREARRSLASEIGDTAEGILGAHRDTGRASISVEHSRLDSFVSLNDPGGNAMSIEFGHTDKRSGKRVDGVHALYRASGLM